MLDKFFADKNHYTRAESPRLRSSYRMAFKVNRHWQLHVWELTGEPSTWQRQLKEKLAAQPVFAVLSGVGGQTWAPIDNFCEEESIPRLFPNVDVPVVAEDDFDSLYLSKGVLLEAGLIAHAIEALPARSAKRRIVQVFRSSDAGVEAAKALAGAMKDGYAAEVVDREVSANADARDVAAVSTAGRNDVLVLWLRAADVAALDNTPPKVATVFLSGRMGGLEETPLPSDMAQGQSPRVPVRLARRPAGWRDFPLGWFRIRQIPVVAIQAQVHVHRLQHRVDASITWPTRSFATISWSESRGCSTPYHERLLPAARAGAGATLCLEGRMRRALRGSERRGGRARR